MGLKFPRASALASGLCVVCVSLLVLGCGGSATDSADLESSANEVNTESPVDSNGSAGNGNGNGESGAGPESGTNKSVDVEPLSTSLQRALATGDAGPLQSADILIDGALNSLADGQSLLSDVVIDLFELSSSGEAKADGSSLTAISWNPTHDAALLTSTFGSNRSVLRTNSVFVEGKTLQDKVIGVVGDQPSRHLVLGSNPMRNFRRDADSVNEQLQRFLENGLSWLMQRENLLAGQFNVVIAQMDDSYYFPDDRAIREWLDTRLGGQVVYNDAGACDDALLAACLSADPDVLIISQITAEGASPQAVENAVRDAMELGLPVLYLHHDGGLTDLGQRLFSLFEVGYEADNYWKKLELAEFDISDGIHSLPAELKSLQTMLGRLKASDYSFDWSVCDGEDCSAVSGLQSEFFDAAEFTRRTIAAFDQSKHDLFSSDKYQLQKILVLLGDKYRQSVRFPMDKLQTDDTEFLRSLFADHSVHYYRNVSASNPPLLDLGNFSRSDFIHVTPTNKTVIMVSKQKFRSAGVYALPGQTFEVTRRDTSDLQVSVFVNTQRSGSTHHYADLGYSRPRFLQSAHLAIASGESIVFTSPYGGPIQLEFSENDLDVELLFKNVGEHPHWRSSEDDDRFAQQLSDGDYDWAEIVTPGFEVHSSLEKMRESMIDPVLAEDAGSARALADATMRYVHNFPHVLAGFRGPGIDIVAEIHGFADAKNLVVDNLDLTKHMNADQATCGYGCSGNPYDAYWSFSPVGHGDIHELGHGLQKTRLRFAGWENHTMTNMYSYYSKTQYFKTTGREPNCQSLPFEAMYQVLLDSLRASDPEAHVRENLWDTMGWSEGAAMFVQLMMSAQDNGVLLDGWHLLPRLHIMEREFARAVSDEAAWLAIRDQLGFGQYTVQEAKALEQNDWLLIAVSTATGLDYRDYFSLWSLPYTASASSQVEVMGYPSLPRKFYVSSGSGYCKGEGFDGQHVILDGAERNWPVQ